MLGTRGLSIWRPKKIESSTTVRMFFFQSSYVEPMVQITFEMRTTFTRLPGQKICILTFTVLVSTRVPDQKIEPYRNSQENLVAK